MTEPQQHSSLSWKKSTASGTGGCVEVARAGEKTFIRDSKDPSGPALIFPGSEWKQFLTSARIGRFVV
ncbi:MAG: DUF397 domain-containing protein [Pseudonocardiaceae bacterium]